jgi:Cu(I)/Ag(I) efflux system membrane fusion protein
VPEVEIQRLEREHLPRQRLTLPSPVTGTVLERNVTHGQLVAPGTTLFTVANLSRVWVMADLYEMDLGRIHVGDPAAFSTDGAPGRTFRSRVEFVYPTVSAETRTVKVRLTLPNADGVLRPGMYGKVAVSARASQAVAVPAESVVRTGEETYVFMARAAGRFEPRRVVTGAQDGEWIQILSGVAAGDTVVASASFLIDSESRLKAAIEGLGGSSATAHGR